MDALSDIQAQDVSVQAAKTHTLDRAGNGIDDLHCYD
jgi:hypothetical protein